MSFKKLPIVSSKELIKFLIEKKGFTYVHTRGDHHIYASRSANRRISVPERKEVGKGLLLKILEEVGSNREEFMMYWNE